ncbi:MAG: DUF5682 family protein [Deinococcales bacterium]
MFHIFGIRHHGPGSARHLLAALKKLKPDCLLIEGPPEGDEVLNFILSDEMKPPVALLIYAPDSNKATFYPFASFSPEWQALRYGLKAGIKLKFFDLPLSYRLAQQADEMAMQKPLEPIHEAQTKPSFHHDPLSYLAQAAGYEDGERWWNDVIEENLSAEEDIFKGILAAMSSLREALGEIEDPWEQRREAYMRQMMRQAEAEGFKRIAVVCGAWHGPALVDLNQAQEDAAKLKDLAAIKLEATWIPWSYRRLARQSGYGAGIHSPGWYEHLWDYEVQTSSRWLAKVAGLLRSEGLEASSAQVIEAVRLAEMLAAMRGRSFAGLAELNEAAEALFSQGNDYVMKLIADRLIIAECFGEIPESTPAAPLQRDFKAQLKRLRLKVELERFLELDLREEGGLERSLFLHRLHLLDIPWGKKQSVSSKGSFKEAWQLTWQSEFELNLIESGLYGQTIVEAAGQKSLEKAKMASLADLGQLLDLCLLADLDIIESLMLSLEQKAAQSSDILDLMRTIGPLARISRYGNVRQQKAQNLAFVLSSLLNRVCIGLIPSCTGIDDEAAQALLSPFLELHQALRLLEQEDYLQLWQETLIKLSDHTQVHKLLAGRSNHLLAEMNLLSDGELEQRLRLALSDPDVEKASAWLEGFLAGALYLLHHDRLLKLLDNWLNELSEGQFIHILALLRRTFAKFSAPERRNIGEKLRSQAEGKVHQPQAQSSRQLNHERGQKVLPILSLILDDIKPPLA